MAKIDTSYLNGEIVKIETNSDEPIPPPPKVSLTNKETQTDVEAGAWNNSSKAYIPFTDAANLNLSNGQTFSEYLFTERKGLQDITKGIIGNFGPDTIRRYSEAGSFSASFTDPSIQQFASAGSDFGSEGNTEAALSTATAAEELSPSGLTSEEGGILRYPVSNSEKNKFDYFSITELEYVPPGVSDARSSSITATPTKERLTKRGSTVILPMHPGISDSNSVGWGDDSLNPIQGALGMVAANAIGNIANSQNVGDVGNAAKTLVEEGFDIVKSVTGDAKLLDFIKYYFAGQAVGANLTNRLGGIVVNPNLELLFTGPNLRSFNYSYKLIPRDDKESKEIKLIIRFFKKAMAAVKSKSGLFLKTPSVFELKYIYGKTNDQHPFLNKIKPCALTSFNVDYTPDGSYMTYNDDGSMTSYNISMSFNELEPIYREDYDEDNVLDSMGY